MSVNGSLSTQRNSGRPADTNLCLVDVESLLLRDLAGFDFGERRDEQSGVEHAVIDFGQEISGIKIVEDVLNSPPSPRYIVMGPVASPATVTQPRLSHFVGTQSASEMVVHCDSAD